MTKSLKIFGIETGKKKYHEEAFYGVAAVFSLMNHKVSTYLKPYDLSVSQFNALMVIKHQGKENGINQVEIADRLLVSASNMTRLIDKLEKAALVERVSQTGDRRINLVCITKKGSDFLDQIWPGYTKEVDDISGRMNKSEQKTLSGLLLKWFSVSREKSYE